MEYLISSTQYILQGCTVTFKLFAITLILSLPLGFVCAMGKTSRIRTIRVLMELYTSVVRGTPLLLQIFFVYYGLPILIPGLRLERFSAAALTFILNYGAYFTEIFRGGMQSIDRGQFEASKVLGMNYVQTMTRIILPQTLKRVLPPVANEAITLVKDTALVVVLGIGDILRNSKEIVARDFTISPFIIAAVVYLVMNYTVVLIFRKLEQRYSVYE
ncbi:MULTISPECIES: amino acid ABC transporter permease [unclassified Oceanispirochaeta]|uniref:amino acid ABC transporter permease n=1 Tax=unclassified Oceanispirochaeta TaxID=2635722 RepID=UPI000E095B99|nr:MULTISPECIES: amino acid ABC transporter permease [unclassified Oceanispirochaeta]MBF9016847.1 amino acid ABC transporter permease [Oceanispirochaeta sp. M2]NPD73210.1 amino acid ABC transporter permease [Oceanispirochaeta sp. M1]RDG31077.1 amino acid ABC transporter permease [Oceanispirochaeta sp. M1]